MFSKILVAVDLLDPTKGKRILEAAAGFAGSAEIRLIYVRYMMEAALKYIDQSSMAAEENAAVAELVELAARAGLPAGQVSGASPMGSPADRILAAAAEWKADLIVIGPHKPSAAKFFLGGEATRIVQRAEVSVLVVR
ncbi:MAG: universal stress protein [Bauldia sp.]|nr:universal stress protein [Bauldia sp.]